MTADRPGRDGEQRCAAAFTTPWGGRRCDLPTGHEGLHIRNDGCGRPEYVWSSPTPPARWDDAAVAARPAGQDEHCCDASAAVERVRALAETGLHDDVLAGRVSRNVIRKIHAALDGASRDTRTPCASWRRTEMAYYLVELRGESREVYSVEAESAEEAREKWADGTLEIQESSSMEVYSVREDD